jgi:hypothetical protein
MPTGATDLGFDVVAQQPRTELNYRVLVDTSGTEASLASIHAEQQVGGGGRLAFSTDSADGPVAQRMLIDHQGNVGIGTGNPRARLDVVGDANFNGPLNVQGPFTVSGIVKIGGDSSVTGPLDVQGTFSVSGAGKIDGDLSVTGKLTAGSFAGDGARISNVTPADNSVSSTKLALDAASLSKVSNETVIVLEDKVGIGLPAPRSKLEVSGDWTDERGALELSGHKPTIRFTGGSDLAERSWIIHLGGNGPGDLEFYTRGPSDTSWVPRMLLTQHGVNVVGSLSGTSNNPGLAGVLGVHTAGQAAVIGTSDSGRGVLGISKSGQGVWGASDTSAAVVGVSRDGEAFRGEGAAGVVGIGKSWVGVYGETQGARDVGPAGVWGDGKQSGDGVKGLTSAPNAAGVAAFHLTNQGPGIFAQGTPAGVFNGDVNIQGRLRASVKSFVIDHPLDPANKYLTHSSVESPDVMNIYNGNITTDKEGNATVVLPDYFEALNRDFRYQLTVIGKFAQAAVVGEIKDNRFNVKTDQPNVKVSWQVTGIRHDALAKAHPLTVEEEKPESQRGLFLNPEHYGQPKSKGIAFVHSLATENPIIGLVNQRSVS